MKALRLSLLSLALLGAPTACGPAATDGGFDSANPAAKMYAIEHAARHGDRSAIRNIVEQLDSDDPAVRSLAIATLKRLTGETYGYRDFDPPHARRDAIARWVQALDSGELTVESTANSSQANPSGEDAEIGNTANHG